MTNNGKNRDLQSQADFNLNRFIFRIQREIPTDSDELERLVNERLVSWGDEENAREDHQARRREMIDQLFVAATKVLTDIQYQIFSAYSVIGMSEIQIAEGFKVTQPYVSIVLSAAVKKIKKHLRLK